MLHLLTGSSTIEVVSDTVTDAEGDTTTVTTAVTAPCHLQPVRPRDTPVGVDGELTVEQMWRVWWPEGTTVAAGQTVTIVGHDLPFYVATAPETWEDPQGTQAFVAAYLRQVR